MDDRYPQLENNSEASKELKKYQDKKYDSLIQQIDAEYNIAWLHQNSKITQQLERLKLYNNQKRDMNAIGDNLLFTVHQTVLASLYDDKLMVDFQGREEGDAETAENLNILAKNDHERMEKDILDYMWDWDAAFFGRGLIMLQEFNRDPQFMCPLPELWDPMTFLRDPLGTSVRGDPKGRGAIRFGGREIYLTKSELKENNGYFNTKWLRSQQEIKSLLKAAAQARDEAQNLTYTLNRELETNLGDNAIISGLQWLTHWKGNPVLVVLAQQRTRIIKYVELKGRFPLIDRPLYPHSHDWAGTSIPDITEDKQRQRSVAINLGLQAMKSDLYPHYLYDEDRIKNKDDLLRFGFNKFTGVAGNDGKPVGTAVMPMNKAQIRMDMVNFILNTLDVSAQKATATPDMQQGQVANQRRTLGELNLVASKVDTRYSLTAKVFGWSEREFWRQWYFKYKQHFTKDLDRKIVRVAGSLTSSWRELTRENTITDVDPDVFIESREVSESKNARDRLLLQAYGNILFTDPNANRRFFLRKLGRLNGFSKDDLMLLLPPTSEELRARDENIELNKNKKVFVNPQDDHMAHLEEHEKAAETQAKLAHITAHKLAMTIKRNQPGLFPPTQQDQQQTQIQQQEQSGQSGMGQLSQAIASLQPGSPAAA